MPIGVIVNSSAVIIGGLIGVFARNRLSKHIINKLPSIFGISAMAMGITLIVNLVNLAPVILAIILGAILGEAFKLEYRITNLISKLVDKAEHNKNNKTEILITVIVLFCFSGSGIFGALIEGFTGDSSILITKSFLDFFTAVTFAVTAGYLVVFVAIPQFVINLILFFSAEMIMPLISSDMILDFKAVGGIITLAAGLKLIKISHFNIINMVPAIVIIVPLSYLWNMI